MEEIKKKMREDFRSRFGRFYVSIDSKTKAIRIVDIENGTKVNGEDGSLIECVASNDIEKFIDSIVELAVSKEREKKIDENTSDGYHTFKELYEFRKIYNACLFNEWAKQGLYDVHKSQRHNDGELCFGRNDYFVVVATLPTGQISNHYPMTDWDLFRCEAVEKAKARWDGHTVKDVVERLINLINTK